MDNNEAKLKANEVTTAKKTKLDKFLGAKFRNQMKNLMKELESCDVHFIRCLKPNEIKKAGYFNSSFSLNQIR